MSVTRYLLLFKMLQTRYAKVNAKITFFSQMRWPGGLLQRMKHLPSAENNFSYLTGHVTFQISILAGHVATLVGH